MFINGFLLTAFIYQFRFSDVFSFYNNLNKIYLEVPLGITVKEIFTFDLNDIAQNQDAHIIFDHFLTKRFLSFIYTPSKINIQNTPFLCSEDVRIKSQKKSCNFTDNDFYFLSNNKFHGARIEIASFSTTTDYISDDVQVFLESLEIDEEPFTLENFQLDEDTCIYFKSEFDNIDSVKHFSNENDVFFIYLSKSLEKCQANKILEEFEDYFNSETQKIRINLLYENIVTNVHFNYVLDFSREYSFS